MVAHQWPCLLAGVALLVMPPAVFAKADTALLTITGGGLANPIRITDPKVLAASHAWGQEFLDVSKPPLTKPPDVRSPFEVTLYSRIDSNDIRKTCVFFYSPGSSTAGIIFLPGKGILWALNAGTVVRQGRDGRWSYASSAWEAVIKPFLARAEAGRGPAPSSISEILAEHWTMPHPGWLYILDPRSDPTRPGSRVWLVDPERASIRGSVRAGYDPDFALSPDGSRLYIASGERKSGELAVIDTATGSIRHIPFPDRVLYQPWYQGLPPFSKMATTSDGRALWISGQHVFSPDKIETRLSVFDTQSERFLDTAVDLGDCDDGNFVASSAANQLYFACASFANRSRVRFVQLEAGRGEVFSSSVELPVSRGCGLAEVFPLSSSNRMAIVRTDGAVYEMDITTHQFIPTSTTGSCQTWAVAPAEWPRSPSGAKLYLGYGGVAPDGMSAATELRVFHTATWMESSRRVKTSVPFWRAVVSQDGRQIYAVSPKRRGIVVLDADTLREKQVIAVGNTPSLAMVAPGSAQPGGK